MGKLHVKAEPIVDDLQVDVIHIPFQRHIYPLSLCVPHDVVHSLLDDAKQSCLHRGGEPLPAVGLKTYEQAMFTFTVSQVLPQRRHQSQFVQGHGPQVVDQAADLPAGRLGLFGELLDLVGQRVLVPGKAFAQRV
jgi:hypothetical protein